MSTQIQKIRFFEGRKAKFRMRKVPIEGLSEYQIYLRKQEQKKKRAAEITTNSSLQEYIDWIWNIQKDLKLSTAQFAARIGVSVQTVNLWKRGSGHFPSEQSFKRLLQLEAESRIEIQVINIKYGVRM